MKYFFLAILFIISFYISVSFTLFVTCVIVAYLLYIEYYFRSSSFLILKEKIKEYTIKCNELNDHIEDLKSSFDVVKMIDYGSGELNDKSLYNFKRPNWEKKQKNLFVYDCSATVCKNASSQPFKYLCKYFNIKVNSQNLSMFESLLNNFEAADQGKKLLEKEKNKIIEGISNDIPIIILKLNFKRLQSELGFKEIDMSDLHYPVYSFQYVSHGGNSSVDFDIRLDVENLNKFVVYLNDLLEKKNSIQGQRSLMTSKLREYIKVRDNFTCKKCYNSTHKESNLLLEIDHIIPLSKGGITMMDNLQTLCWKCNRSKGSKIENI